MKISVKLIASAVVLGMSSTFLYMRYTSSKTTSTAQSSSSTAQNSNSVGYISGPSAIYEKKSPEELFVQSNIIIEGKVLGFSSAKWNGKTPGSVSEWENSSSTPYHLINIKVLQSFTGAKVGQVISVTESGSSPIQSKLAIGNQMLVTTAENHNLKVGDQGVFFLNSQYGLPWISSDGKTRKREAIQFLAGPEQSFGKSANGKFMVLSTPLSPEDMQKNTAQHAAARAVWYKKRCIENARNPGCS